MRKRGMLPLAAIAAIVIAVVVLYIVIVLYFWGPGALGNQIKATFFGLTGLKYLKPATEVPAAQFPIASEAMNNLENVLKRAKATEDTLCLIEYKPFSLEEKSAIKISSLDQDTILTLMKSEDDVLTTIESKKVEGLQPCIVDGESFTQWIDSPTRDILRPKLPLNLQLPFGVNSNNKIWYKEDSKTYEYNKEDKNYLFKIDNKHVCFFVTTTGLWFSDPLEKFEVDPGDITTEKISPCKMQDITLGDLPWPVDTMPVVTSCFGERNLNRQKDTHNGIDIRAAKRTEVKAIMDGKVKVFWPDYNGLTIKTDSGLEYTYLHLDRAEVSVGQSVTKGSFVGYSGDKGSPGQPHLHLQIIKDGKLVDPLSFYDTSKISYTKDSSCFYNCKNYDYCGAIADQITN